MTKEMIRVHEAIQKFRALGAWGIAKAFEEILEGMMS